MRSATPEDAQEVCSALRATLARSDPGSGRAGAGAVRRLGQADNVAGIMAQPDVDGALVGGASLEAEDFVRICRYKEHIEH